MKRVILTILMAVVFPACAAADSITFTLDPASGNVKGNAGSVVGWGFTITNATSDWLGLNGSTFLGSSVDGNYMDYLTPAFTVVAPGATLMESWNASSTPQLGVGEFDVFASAQPGTSIVGSISVGYDGYTLDPSDPNSPNDPNFQQVIFDNQTNSEPVEIAVPESSSLSLLISALFLPIMFAGWRRRSRGVLKESRA